ncbi:MAG: iron ABC transporter permease [bacterium]
MSMRGGTIDGIAGTTDRGGPRLVALALAAALALLLALSLTGRPTSPLAVAEVLAGGGDPVARYVVFELRLPRALLAALVGAGLAMSGLLLQGVTRNPLADPGLLGISGGAGLAVLVLMATYPDTRAAPLWLLPLVAFAGGLCAAALILTLAGGAGRSQPARLLLVGIGVAAATGAIAQVFALGVRNELFRAVVAWQAGTLSGGGWPGVAVLAPGAALGGLLALALAHRLDVLALGDEAATALGVHCVRTRMAATALAALLAGACVAIAGGLGFIGLFAPHIARTVVGQRHLLLVPAAAAIGAAVTCGADIVAHRLIPHTVLPTGAVVAVIGVPWLVFSLKRMYRRG